MRMRTVAVAFLVLLLTTFPGGGVVAQEDKLDAPEVLLPDWSFGPAGPSDSEAPSYVRGIAYPTGAGTGGGDVLEAEPNDDLGHAYEVVDVPFQSFGVISTNLDIDWLLLNVTEGQPIQIDAFRRIASLSSPLNPQLWVVDFYGHNIAINDDVAPGNLNSEVWFVAPYTGVIYVGVLASDHVGGPAYGYILSAWPAAGPIFTPENLEDEPNGIYDDANPIVVPGAKVGATNDAGDEDWFEFEAEAGTTLVVDVHARAYAQPIDLEASVRDFYGWPIFVNDNADSVADPRFNIVLPYTGTYYLMVTHKGDFPPGPLNAYILSASLQEGTGAPTVTGVTVTPDKRLTKVRGTNFVPDSTVAEVNYVAVPSYTSVKKPTTLIKVRPPVSIKGWYRITVCNANGRRSNQVLVRDVD